MITLPLSRLLPTHVVPVALLNCNNGLTPNLTCKQIDHRGADIDILVNTATQRVLMSVTKQTPDTDIIYGGCNIVDADNWTCETPMNIGMARGQYYQAGSLSASGVSGWKYWALQLHLIDLDAAAYWPEKGSVFGIDSRHLKFVAIVMGGLFLFPVFMALVAVFLAYMRPRIAEIGQNIAKKFPQISHPRINDLITLILTMVVLATILLGTIWIFS